MEPGSPNKAEIAEKLNKAHSLIAEALDAEPRLKGNGLDETLPIIAEAAHLMSAPNNKLSLNELMVREEWYAGQKFYDIKGVIEHDDRSGEKCVVVGADQEIPEGVLLDAAACPLPTGSVVHVTAQIKRSGTKQGNCRWSVGEPSLAGLAADRA